ncbi:MAG: hypothetical protein ABI222_00150 [Opitutaceae bacterium]
MKRVLCWLLFWPLAVVAADVDLKPGWEALATYKTGQSLKVFDRAIKSDAAATVRTAKFGRAVALLDRQPVTPSQVEESRATFAALADSGGDDVAQGARFFLGRIAQHHLQQPNPEEAAHQYRQLIAEHENSIWAQTALSRLALLEIYALEPEASPAARIAEAEKLLAHARNASAETELHVAIANAIFFYRLPAEAALPHLLAAERLGRLDWTARAEALVQIAELSRLAGERAQAAKFYQTFLTENPRDLRHYIIKQRLAEMEKPAP